ncbi:MAG: hypothetical protein AAB487_03525 [Patescibacteria group bacterium]
MQEQVSQGQRRLFWIAFFFMMVAEVLACDAIYEYREHRASKSASHYQVFEQENESGKVFEELIEFIIAWRVE